MNPDRAFGYAAKTKSQPLELIGYEVPQLHEGEVRVSVTHCGLCYTDIHAIDDYYGITDYPFMPGHEVVGIVSEVKGESGHLKVGDRVGIGWQGRSCGQCEWCMKGEEQLCLKIVRSATWKPNGGLSDSVVVDGRFAHPLPQGMPSEDAAVLMCAGISVYNPLKTYQARGARSVGIVGIGGLGHLAVMFASKLGYEVTVISSTKEKQGQAESLGADHFIWSGDREAMGRAEFSLDLLLCTAHGALEWEALIDVVKKRGQVVLVGFPDVDFNSTDLVAHEVAMSGSFLGNRRMMPEMLAFAAAMDIRPIIEIMPMSRVNDAIERLRENKVRYRIVLFNDIRSKKP